MLSLHWTEVHPEETRTEMALMLSGRKEGKAQASDASVSLSNPQRQEPGFVGGTLLFSWADGLDLLPSSASGFSYGQ